MKLLVPIDGSDVSLRALEHAAALARQGIPMRVHVVNVQAPLSADVARFIAHDVIEEYHEERGEEALADAKQQLEAAGVSFETSVVVGSPAQAIVHAAEEHGCDGIIMGTQGTGTVKGLLLGSTATKVVHLSPLPVTLVR